MRFFNEFEFETEIQRNAKTKQNTPCPTRKKVWLGYVLVGCTTYRKFCISVRLMANEFLRSLLHDFWSVCWANSHFDSLNGKNKRKLKLVYNKTQSLGRTDMHVRRSVFYGNTHQVTPRRKKIQKISQKFQINSKNSTWLWSNESSRVQLNRFFQEFHSDDWNKFWFFSVKHSKNLPYSFDARTKRMSWRFSGTNRAVGEKKSTHEHLTARKLRRNPMTRRESVCKIRKYVNLFALTLTHICSALTLTLQWMICWTTSTTTTTTFMCTH